MVRRGNETMVQRDVLNNQRSQEYHQATIRKGQRNITLLYRNISILYKIDDGEWQSRLGTKQCVRKRQKQKSIADPTAHHPLRNTIPD